MLPFKKGAFHVAVDSGLPILPIVMSDYGFMDKKNKVFGRGNIHIQILEPIPTDNFVNTKENLNALIESTRSLTNGSLFWAAKLVDINIGTLEFGWYTVIR